MLKYIMLAWRMEQPTHITSLKEVSNVHISKLVDSCSMFHSHRFLTRVHRRKTILRVLRDALSVLIRFFQINGD